jgi:poly(3-hydroxybutyrate) depolymerase
MALFFFAAFLAVAAHPPAAAVALQAEALQQLAREVQALAQDPRPRQYRLPQPYRQPEEQAVSWQHHLHRWNPVD